MIYNLQYKGMIQMKNIEICGDYNYPPFEFINSKGEFAGFNIDITKQIAKEMNFNVSFDLLEWSQAIKALRNGKYKAIQGMSISSSRKKDFNFSKEYLTVVHSIFTLKERDDISRIDDLYSLRIAVQENDISFDILTTMANKKEPIHVVVMSSQEEILEQLFLNKVDAIAGNRLTIMYFLERLKKAHLIKSIGEPINITKFGIGVRKDRDDLLDLFNEGIQRIKRKGIYKEIYDSWFEQQVNYIDYQIIENIGTGVVCINKLGYITAINNSASVLLNISREEQLFKSFYESKLIEIIDSNLIEKVLYDELGDAVFEEIKYEGDGIETNFNVNISPLLNHINNANGVIISFKDVTSEKKLVEALITKDKMQSLGRLISNVAHEIRNPFTSIKNFINLIPENIDDPEFIESLLIHVPKQIDAIDSILKELMEYSTPKSPNISSINLKTLVDSILKITKPDKCINFREQIPKDVNIRADERHLRQILINIILNAIDSVEENGNIYITAMNTKRISKIMISDDGKGISKENLNRIFDPFFTTKETGTGLGLYITYQLVKENNGEIEIFTNDTGIKVIISLPTDDE